METRLTGSLVTSPPCLLSFCQTLTIQISNYTKPYMVPYMEQMWIWPMRNQIRPIALNQTTTKRNSHHMLTRADQTMPTKRAEAKPNRWRNDNECMLHLPLVEICPDCRNLDHIPGWMKEEIVFYGREDLAWDECFMNRMSWWVEDVIPDIWTRPWGRGRLFFLWTAFCWSPHT